MSDTKLTISRRDLLRGAAALGGTAVIGAPMIARGAQPMRLTFGHGAAPGNPRSVAADKFAEIVKQKSNGAIEVTVAGSAQLGDDMSMLTSLRTGSLDITANSQGTTSTLVPELGAFGLPFLFADADAGVRTAEKFTPKLRGKFEAIGIVPLGWWDNGIRDITNRKHAIHEPKDLKGLKIRTPPDQMTVDIFTALGAATQQIAFAELYVALQQGVVDGQENPLTNIYSAKLYEVNKYISLSGHKWESTPVLMSKIAWGRLDGKARSIVAEAIAESTKLQLSLSDTDNVKLLGQFRANPAVSVNDVDRGAFRKATASVYAKWEAKPFGSFVKELAASTQG